MVCTVVAFEPNRTFGWHVGDINDPAAQWRFELEPLAEGTRLRFAMVLGPGPSGLTAAIDARPGLEARIISHRQSSQAANMRRTIEGIRDLAEAATA